MDSHLGIEDVLITTRAVRKRLDFSKPVERQVIEECLAAQQAPNGGNLQPGALWSSPIVPSAPPSPTSTAGVTTPLCPVPLPPRWAMASHMRAQPSVESWRQLTIWSRTSTKRLSSSFPASPRAPRDVQPLYSMPSTAPSCPPPGASCWQHGLAAWAPVGPFFTSTTKRRRRSFWGFRTETSCKWP
jgi:hypothetical protein